MVLILYLIFWCICIFLIFWGMHKGVLNYTCEYPVYSTSVTNLSFAYVRRSDVNFSTFFWVPLIKIDRWTEFQTCQGWFNTISGLIRNVDDIEINNNSLFLNIFCLQIKLLLNFIDLSWIEWKIFLEYYMFNMIFMLWVTLN